VHFEFPAGARPEIQDIKFYWVRKPYLEFTIYIARPEIARIRKMG
jgi:hypothetical protein